MANLKTDSPLSRRIVLSFLDFLNSVEPAHGVDVESLEVAKECLAEAFNINPLSVDTLSKSDSLVNIFSSRESIEQQGVKSDLSHERFPTDAPTTSSANNAAGANLRKTSELLDEDWQIEDGTLGIARDELFGQFFCALEKTGYLKTTADGHDDEVQLDRATRLFHNALLEMRKSGCQTFDQKNLAETLKVQGNKAMQSKLYADAIELYTLAIALCEDNAVYYCNRAAAHTQTNRYIEAISDCLKSIEIDPNYSKAYSRLGFVYFAQGNYREAIDKGFSKALELDPNSDSIKENIRVAEQKLEEQQRRTEHGQNSSSAPFTSPFNINGLPVQADLAGMLRNMTANVYQGQGQHSQDGPEGVGGSADPFNEPEIRVGGGNININLGDQMPEELSGALRSVMEMFSGAATSGSSHDSNSNGRPGPS